MEFSEIDRILEQVSVCGGADSGAGRIEALTRIALAVFGYCSVVPGAAAGGLKYYLYVQEKLLEGICRSVRDERIPPETRVVFAREYFRIRYESGAVWNPDDSRLAQTDTAVRELLAACMPACVQDDARPESDAELLRRSDLLRLLMPYARYAAEVPMAWKAFLDGQIGAWIAALDGSGRWAGLTAGQALLRIGILAKYRRVFSAAYDLAPAYAAVLPDAMVRIPAAGSSRDVSALYEALCEHADAPTALDHVWRLRELLEMRLARRARFTDSTHPADVADARLAVKSICIEIACREHNID